MQRPSIFDIDRTLGRCISYRNIYDIDVNGIFVFSNKKYVNTDTCSLLLVILELNIEKAKCKSLIQVFVDSKLNWARFYDCQFPIESDIK